MKNISMINYEKLQENTLRKIFNPFKHAQENHDMKGFKEENTYVQNMTTLWTIKF
jgi:phosphopantetheinyl transferase